MQTMLRRWSQVCQIVVILSCCSLVTMSRHGYLTDEQRKELRETARAIVAPGKGILAADQSTGTMGKRLDTIKVANTTENRRQFRQLLVTGDKSIGSSISGVIFSHEGLYQKADDGTPFVKLIRDLGIIPGIKVDSGLVRLYYSSYLETTTQGLDGLDGRAKQYYDDGAKFAKWRSVFKINSGHSPSHAAMVENGNVLARYASICQAHGLVPIIEAEILTDGTHDLEAAQDVTEEVLSHVYRALFDNSVYIEGTILMPNMVLPGYDSPKKYTPGQVAEATLLALMRTVPPIVPGIAFLSGGQSELDSTVHLNAINKYAQMMSCQPWKLTFSFGRSLEATVLKTWQGRRQLVKTAQDELLVRAKANSLACLGKYAGEAPIRESVMPMSSVDNYDQY